MHDQRGTTLLELVTVIAVASILAAVAVPAAASLRTGLAGGTAARRLVLVLRSAEARAQSRGVAVQVAVDGAGDYTVSEDGAEPRVVDQGSLGVPVSGNYPAGVVELSAAGWPCLPGSRSPRAGHFVVGVGARSRVVVLQLSGCVRCE